MGNGNTICFRTYLRKTVGLFAVESEALENSTCFSPYTKNEKFGKRKMKTNNKALIHFKCLLTHY